MYKILKGQNLLWNGAVYLAQFSSRQLFCLNSLNLATAVIGLTLQCYEIKSDLGEAN